MSTLKLSFRLCALLLAVSAFAEKIDGPIYSTPTKHRDRINTILHKCLAQNFAKTACSHITSFTPIKPDSTNFLSAYVSEPISAIAQAEGRFVRHTGHTLLSWIRPEDDEWLRALEVRLDYEGLKRLVATQAKRQGLVDCQKACLATCVASNLIDYNPVVSSGSPEEAIKTVRRLNATSWRTSLENGDGACVQYSRIASDIMVSLGLKAAEIDGISYALPTNPKENLALVEQGPHAMVSVKVGNKHYIMEPQLEECAFYSTEFHPAFRPELPMRALNSK